MAEIWYADRNGKRKNGTTGQDRLLEFLYGHRLTRILLRPLVSPVVSRLGGAFLDSGISRIFVDSFVKKNGIDLSLYEKQTFSSYNEFFTRKIRPERRPADPDRQVLISPGDGKVSVYPIRKNGRFLIKHTRYTAEQLLGDRMLAKRYQGGWIYVIRLTVDDYHRYCYPADGVKSEQRILPGVLHTVNPVANDCYPIYKMNSREYCLLKTKQFGTLVLMEVGALMVGRICNNDPGKQKVTRGAEKGRFEFGGSTIIVMTQPGVVEPDQTLLVHSAEQMETLVKQGESLGRSKKIPGAR